MKIRVRQEGKIVVLNLEGSIDINTANFIEATGQLIREGHTKMLCNFKGVDMVDYNGLSIITIAYKNIVNKGGTMKFCNVSLHIKEFFKMVRLDLVFDIYDDEDKALRAFEVVSKIDKLHLRRRFKRLEFYHPIKFHLAKQPGAKKLSGKMLNISGAGMFIHTKHLYPLSTKLFFEVKMDNNKKYTLQGVISWHADKELQPHCYPGIGVQFVNLTSETQREIIEFVDKNTSLRSNM